jgi:acyl-CoA thioesterase I
MKAASSAFPRHPILHPIVHLSAQPRAWVRCRLGLLLLLGMISGAAAQQNLAIYTDSLQNNWNNWSWGSTIDFSYSGSSQYIHGGSRSIAIAITNGWAALFLHHTAFDSSPYSNLTIWVNGGPYGGQALAVKAVVGGTLQGGQYQFVPTANTWQRITVPLATLGAAGATNFDGIWIQSQSSLALPVFYVDDMSLLPPGPLSAADSTISASPGSITADGTSTSTLTVQAKDVNNNNLTSSAGTVTLSTTAGSMSGVMDNLNGTYTGTLTSAAAAGTADITGTIGGIAIGHPAAVTFTPRPGTLEFNRIESVPTGTHIEWNAAPGQNYSVLAGSNLVNWSPAWVGVAGEFIDADSRAGVPQKFYRVKENMNPNRRISIGKPVFGVTAQPYQNASGLNDGIFKTSATTWNAGWPTPAAPAWVAIHLGQGPTRVLLEWNAGWNYNYQETDYGGPGNYAIYTSSNSTTGAEGTWSQVVSVTNNIYRTRSHSFDFTGMTWVKMVITAAPWNSINGAQLDEIEVYDISAAHGRGRIAEDTWFFMGDSITALWADRGTASGTNDPASHQPGFAARINSDNTNYFPATINGGIGGETSAGALARLAQNLADNPDYYYWTLNYGANDSAGNTTNTATFRANMQAMINMLLANGRMPVIPHISYASDGGHNYVTNFNAVIDDLVLSNRILAGPDCYTFFKANPSQLSDGLHPNDAGMRSYNLLWSQAMRHLYP